MVGENNNIYGPYLDPTSVWYHPLQCLAPSPNLPLPRGRFCLQSEWGQCTKTGGAVQGSAGQCWSWSWGGCRAVRAVRQGSLWMTPALWGSRAFHWPCSTELTVKEISVIKPIMAKKWGKKSVDSSLEWFFLSLGKTSEGQTVIYILKAEMTFWVLPLLLLLLHGGQHGVDCLPQGQASPAGGQGGEEEWELQASCSSLFIGLYLFPNFEMTYYCLPIGVLVKNQSVSYCIRIMKRKGTNSEI